MKIDILTAKLLKKGFNQQKAEAYAVELTNIAKLYGVSPYDFIDELSEDSSFNELGEFVFNNANQCWLYWPMGFNDGVNSSNGSW